MTNSKICLKCLDINHGGKHCQYCGRELLDFTLMCECGAEIVPHIWARRFPPWGKAIDKKYCPDCGRDIRKPVKEYIEELKLAV